MELNDIIKSDKDRLFVLDHECFIIYTADDLADGQPFIRIGNWIDLPPESIPLIENIIVTDSVTGNPVHEQFNIDPRYLSTNKYIGSSQTLKNYLDFQKNFGLDLNNVSIVEVEKDLPSLTKEKKISSKDAFIGIFYYNGNFKVDYNDKNLFDLKEFEAQAGYKKTLETISSRHKESEKFSGSGIVLLDRLPVFFKKRYFTAFQFLKNFGDFDDAGIDPGKIREIMLPVLNLDLISGFIKWMDSRNGMVKIFTNSAEETESLQKLFPNAMIKREDFGDCSFNTSEGLFVENYKDSTNMKLTFRNVLPSGEKLVFAYLNDYRGIQQIIREELDCILVPYTIFEKANLFMKTAECPLVYLDDGNRNVSKLKSIDSIILHDNIVFEFRRFIDIDSLLKDALKLVPDKTIIDSISRMDLEEIKRYLFFDNESTEEKQKDEAKIREALNICSILRIYLNTTTDRKFYSDIRRILQKALVMFDRNVLKNKNTYRIKSLLFFHDKSVYEFFEQVEIKKEEPRAAATVMDEDIDRRIETDRARFRALLDLYGKSTRSKKEFAELSREISRRKQNLNETLSSNPGEVTKNIFMIRFKKFAKIFLAILIAAIVLFGLERGYRVYRKYSEEKRIEKERLAQIEAERLKAEREKREKEEKATREKQEKEELVQKYKIHVSDRDIYEYANMVAKKNGYREITFKALKENNPNWIFPGNVFYLMDGEKIVVKWGDTLWDISDKKLMGIYLDFYRLAERIEQAGTKEEKIKLYNSAKELAFSKKQNDTLKKIAGELGIK